MSISVSAGNISCDCKARCRCGQTSSELSLFKSLKVQPYAHCHGGEIRIIRASCVRGQNISARGSRVLTCSVRSCPTDVICVQPSGVFTYSWRDEENEVLKSLYEKEEPLHEGVCVYFSVWVPPNGQHLSVWERIKSWWRLLTMFSEWFIQELERQAVFVINERREGVRWQPGSPS